MSPDRGLSHTLKVFTGLLLLHLLLLLPASGIASHEEGAHVAPKEKFNAGKLILEHISDEHGWHILTLGEGTAHETHVSLPLPVIIYSKTKGLTVFSSAAFTNHETHASRQWRATACMKAKLYPKMLLKFSTIFPSPKMCFPFLWPLP